MNLGFFIQSSPSLWPIIHFHWVVLPFPEENLWWVVLLAITLTFTCFEQFHHDSNPLLSFYTSHSSKWIPLLVFSYSKNMKILSRTFLFKLIKVNEKMSIQYNFNPFLDWERIATKNEYLSQTWLRGSLEYCFLPFQIRETIYEREI